MIRHILPTLLGALTVGQVALASEVIKFGPVAGQAGQSVRLSSRSEARDGIVETTKDGKTTKDSIRFYRERELVWTFREPTADGTRRGMVEIGKMATFTSVTSGGREQKSEDQSPLNGMMISMSKAPKGDWTFELDGSIPRLRVQQEIEELTVYLKRRWYPDQPVRVGDSWEFDPIWIRMIMRKDLENAKIIGTMKLRQIRRTATRHLAIIDVSVRGSGGNFQADGTEQHAKIDLKGQTTVDLKTMLDESLELNGTLETRSGKPSASINTRLPLRLVVNKNFTKSGGL